MYVCMYVFMYVWACFYMRIQRDRFYAMTTYIPRRIHTRAGRPLFVFGVCYVSDLVFGFIGPMFEGRPSEAEDSNL